MKQCVNAVADTVMVATYTAWMCVCCTDAAECIQVQIHLKASKIHFPVLDIAFIL